jgi:hypothetical protein
MLHVNCRMDRIGILDPDSLFDLRCHRRVPGSLLACVFIICHLAPHAASQELLFDGTTFESESGEVLLTPGECHYAEVVIPNDVRIDSELRVVVKLRSSHGYELTSSLGITRSSESSLGDNARRARAELGPLVAPPVYQFEAGQVFQQGYRLSISVIDGAGQPVKTWSFYQEHGKIPSDVKQGMGEVEPESQRIRFVPGINDQVIYNPRYGSMSPLSLRLHESVLNNQDDLQILMKLNDGEVPDRMRCLLRITDSEATELRQENVELEKGQPWQNVRVECSAWPTGSYRIELLPLINDEVWQDGHELQYHRRQSDDSELFVSPVSPWKLERDSTRPEIRIADFREEHQKTGDPEPSHFRWVEGPDRSVAMSSDGDFNADPFIIRPEAAGHYAVFVAFEDSGGLIQVGRNGPIRGVELSGLSRELFVEARDLTDHEIRVYPSRDPKSQLVSLRLVPVTEVSSDQLRASLARPPMPLISVNDWAEYFGTPWARLLPDQFTSIVAAQAEIGFSNVGWSVGRSWVEYPSKLPHAQVFPCIPWDEARKSPDYPDDPYDYSPRIVMMNQFNPLLGAYEGGRQTKTKIWPWLAMQRHYGTSMYGGIFASSFYRSHPEWRCVSKDGKPSGLSFYFPEVRNERVDILMEVAELGADGLLVGCDRQVPMLQYEPPMVEEFRIQSGIDATKIDSSDRASYERWIRFRADFFTQTLRELKQRLEDLAVKRGSRIPIGIRIPAGGLFLNMAQGLDVETWCREGLVDLIDVDPLEESPGESSQDIRPYLDLGHRHGIPVIAGIGSTAFRIGGPIAATSDFSVITPGLKRARGLHYAGVDGIDTYETEVLAWTDPVRFAVALYGHPLELDRFLRESNIEAVYPITAGNAAAGHDNHSVWRPDWVWSMLGFNGRSL